MLTRRRERQLQLAVASMGVAIVLLIAIYIGTAILFWEHAKAQTPNVIIAPPTSLQALPLKCAALSKEPDPESWDAETDSYPRNYEWEKCMGVAPQHMYRSDI